jgi:glycosyltransferase involved in cell wall biosynthesis
LKIALLGPAPPFKGGIALFAEHLAQEFLRLGHEVMFFNFKKQYPALIFPGGKQEEGGEPSAESLRLLTPWLPHSFERTISAINSFVPDLVIVSWWLPFFAPAYGYILRRIKRGKKLILAHNIIPHESWPLSKKLLRFAFEPADGIVVLSKACMKDLKRVVSNKLVLKAHQGFHPLYSTFGEDISKTNVHSTLLFFGMIKPYKGLDILLNAMPLIRQEIPDIRLIIAGSVYKDQASYEEMIEDLGLADAVETRFHYVKDEEVQELFRKSDVCVLPYKTATQSGVIATSYSYDTPVIASDVGGLGEYIKEGKTGFLVEPDSAPALAHAVIDFYKNQQLLPMQANIAKIKEDQSWNNLVNIFLEI